MTRRYYEDLDVGREYAAGPIALDEEEIVGFARDWDPQPHHVDADVAGASEFGGITAAGVHVFATFMKLTHRLDPPVAVVAALEATLGFLAPTRPGDALRLVGACTEKRESRSRPECGVARFESRLLNQRDEVVLEVRSVLLVARRAGDG